MVSFGGGRVIVETQTESNCFLKFKIQEWQEIGKWSKFSHKQGQQLSAQNLSQSRHSKSALPRQVWNDPIDGGRLFQGQRSSGPFESF